MQKDEHLSRLLVTISKLHNLVVVLARNHSVLGWEGSKVL
jgi:hypothetical protein